MARRPYKVAQGTDWIRTTEDRVLWRSLKRCFSSSGLQSGEILRKFYTPGNCVCRVVVYKPRHSGVLDVNLAEQIAEFFREEKSGVFVAGNGDVAVALFRTPRGYYMLDPADRDRYGRAVAPPCAGRARACLSQYPDVRPRTALRANLIEVKRIRECRKGTSVRFVQPPLASGDFLSLSVFAPESKDSDLPVVLRTSV